jgi:threonine dehydrogenase-like Zn-dependent dehydrogenase
LLRADPNATSSRRRDQTQWAMPFQSRQAVIANIGVHGTKVDLHLESLWDRNITITTRLVDTVSTPMLLKSLGSKKIDPKLLITRRFKLDRILDAYVWPRGQDESAQGDHRGLTHNHEHRAAPAQ